MRIEVRHIAASRSGMDMEVAVPADRLRVSADEAQRALAAYPNLARHVCVNERGETFGDDIVGTETAHLFEHLVIELQAQAGTGEGLVGHTSWAEELAVTAPQGIALFRVKVTFHDDLAALKAAKEAVAFINAL